MTDQELERRLQALYRARVGADGAPPQLRADLTAIGQQAETRSLPTRWRLPRMSRSAPMAFAATALVAAIAIGLAFFLGRAPDVGPTGSPSPSARDSAAPSTSPSPGLPLGGGLIIAYAPHPPAACTISESPFDVFTIDAGTGERVVLGTVGTRCDPDRLALQWAPDRVHVLMTDYYSNDPLIPGSITAAGRQLSFICCNLPEDAGGFQTADGWVLSPAGDRIAAVHTSSIGNTGIADGVVVVNIDGSGATTLMLPTGAEIAGSQVAWSPDESAILVAACLPCNHADRGQPPSPPQVGHLFVIPVDGSPVRDVISADPGTVWGAAWSSDGTRLAALRGECLPGEAMPFCSIPGMTASLELVGPTDGTEQVLVTSEQVGEGLAEIAAPMWSSDGTHIAFSSFLDPSGPSDVFVVDADSGGLTNRGKGILVGWSPDGEWLLVARGSAPDVWSDMWVVRADGTDARELGTFRAGDW